MSQAVDIKFRAEGMEPPASAAAAAVVAPGTTSASAPAAQLKTTQSLKRGASIRRLSLTNGVENEWGASSTAGSLKASSESGASKPTDALLKTLWQSVAAVPYVPVRVSPDGLPPRALTSAAQVGTR